MSKADQLGSSAAFRRAGTGRSSRRDAINSSLTGEGQDVTAITELPVTVISDNPDNPRNHLRNLDETTESIREIGVILPIVVGTVEAYLRDRPNRVDDLDKGAQYVVIDGHRRLECSRRAGLATIPVRVDNAHLATDEAILEAAFVANYHRDDMTELEEAHALKQLVDYYGSQTHASKRLGIRQSTISSKLSLLKITPELQKDLMTGERTAEQVRNLGKLSPQEQIEKADQRREATRARTAAPNPVQTPSGPGDYHGVIIPDEASRQAADPGEAGSAAKTPAVPEPRVEPEAQADVTAGQVVTEGRKLPYDDGPIVGRHLALKMASGPFLQALKAMAAECWDKVGEEASFDVLRAMLEAAAEHNPKVLNDLADEFLMRTDEALNQQDSV